MENIFEYFYEPRKHFKIIIIKTEIKMGIKKKI